MEAIIQFFSTVALLTLGYITYFLSRHRNAHTFIKVGQDVFRWLLVALVCITLNRLLLTLHLVDATVSREVNGVAFIISVIGIVGSVYKHGQADKQ